ncbi:hypothetical protein KI387_044262 [Taxus chinensis]|uniref:Reverse transcriptase domain-containing protein n=1 Tax=Taxus chinensis TaxID=29808 RepID=A0AA38FCM4_TAXCH|nr:hypothetical protein KI387_044262 [Taxus chinensis]
MGPPPRGPTGTQDGPRAQSSGALQQRPQQTVAGSSGSTVPTSRAPSDGAAPWRSTGGCFGCGVVGNFWRDFPQNPNKGKAPISEPTVGDMGRSHRIYAVVENRQAEHQSTVIETSGSIGGIPTSILFDSGSSDSIITPSLVERCKLVAVRQGLFWDVEMASGAKISVDSLVKECVVDLGSFTTSSDLRILPLGSYGVILGMDWLSAHRARMDCYHKTISCVDDLGVESVIVGVRRPVSIRTISAMQLKRCVRWGCQMYAVTVSDRSEDGSDGPSLDDHPILGEFVDVFPGELPGMPPPREIDFHIDLVLRSRAYLTGTLLDDHPGAL